MIDTPYDETQPKPNYSIKDQERLNKHLKSATKNLNKELQEWIDLALDGDLDSKHSETYNNGRARHIDDAERTLILDETKKILSADRSLSEEDRTYLRSTIDRSIDRLNTENDNPVMKTKIALARTDDGWLNKAVDAVADRSDAAHKPNVVKALQQFRDGVAGTAGFDNHADHKEAEALMDSTLSAMKAQGVPEAALQKAREVMPFMLDSLNHKASIVHEGEAYDAAVIALKNKIGKKATNEL